MIDSRKLKKRCNQSIKSFHRLGETVQVSSGRCYTFIDNDSDILAVAHLDTVVRSRRFVQTGDFVISGRLDDRLGVHIILDILPALGVQVDILLTEGEEIMQSTANWFRPEKRYKWIVEFDRSGTDVVLYQYEIQQAIDAVQSVGGIVGQGSYSDICDLQLDCCGFNFGTGYYRQHSSQSYAYLTHVNDMIHLFLQFYHKYKDTEFLFDDLDSGLYSDWYTDESCPDCQSSTTQFDGLEYCTMCSWSSGFWGEERCPDCGTPMTDDWCHTCGYIMGCYDTTLEAVQGYLM